MNTRAIGAAYEDRAIQYLEGNRYTILARNYRCRIGEIDIIAWDHTGEHPVLTFLEVKYRRSRKAGYPEESVTVRKQKTIRRVAEFFLMQNRITSDTPCRFDVIVFEGESLRHIVHAF